MKINDQLNLLTRILEIDETIEKGFFSLKFKDAKLEKECSDFLVKDIKIAKIAKIVIYVVFILLELKRVFFS